eukprot:3729566-Rhodomonas_salina.3
MSGTDICYGATRLDGCGPSSSAAHAPPQVAPIYAGTRAVYARITDNNADARAVYGENADVIPALAPLMHIFLLLTVLFLARHSSTRHTETLAESTLRSMTEPNLNVVRRSLGEKAGSRRRLLEIEELDGSFTLKKQRERTEKKEEEAKEEEEEAREHAREEEPVWDRQGSVVERRPA